MFISLTLRAVHFWGQDNFLCAVLGVQFLRPLGGQKPPYIKLIIVCYSSYDLNDRPFEDRIQPLETPLYFGYLDAVCKFKFSQDLKMYLQDIR